MRKNTGPALREEIANLQSKLVEVEAAEEIERQLPAEHQLANILHELLCHWNHTDGCGWYYEFKNRVADWDRDTHKGYLKKAVNLIARCEREGITPEDAIRIYKLMEKL